ncbi:MAG: hypothetical protein ACRBN8_02320 [Nannocystales bacterium]
MPWVPAHPQHAYRTADGLTYQQVYIATVAAMVPSQATLQGGFSTTRAPRTRPRLRAPLIGPQTHVQTGDHQFATAGTIWTSGLDSCIAIAIGAYDPHNNRFTRIGLAHLTGGYYPGGTGAGWGRREGSWRILLQQMGNTPPAQLYAVLAGSSHRGGWYADSKNVMGGIHSAGNGSNPDTVYGDLHALGIPPENFRFYALAPGLCHTMRFGIRLQDGLMGETQ